MTEGHQSPRIVGVESHAEVGELRVVTADGIASGAGTASGAGASITAAVGSAVGGTTIRQATPLPLRAQVENSISIGQTATFVDEDIFHSATITVQTEAADSALFEGRVVTPSVRRPVAAQGGEYRINGHAPIVEIRPFRQTNEAESAARFELLEARVFALENALLTIRQQRTPGFGHNRGPGSFAPWSTDDEDEIRHLVALLKQQTPTAAVEREELVAAMERASKIAEKIKEYADDFCKAAAKRGGEKLGESVFSLTWWIGMATSIILAVEAVSSWLGGL